MATDPTNTALAAQNKVRVLSGEGAFQCVMALLQFILADPLLRSAIIGFLETCKTQIALQKALLELAVGQLKVTFALLESEVTAVSALFSIADGLGNRFPLGVFARCPLTASMAAAAHSGMDFLVPAGAGGSVMNLIKKAKTKVRDLQYKVARMNQMLDQMNATIERCTLLTAQIDAIEEFINALADFPGPFTLPLAG